MIDGVPPIDEWRWSQLVNAKLVDDAKDIARAEASKGNIGGARAWKRVQVSAAGWTQNRRTELQSELNNFKPAASFDVLAVVLLKWQRKVRDLEHFPIAGVAGEVKMDQFLKIIPTSWQQSADLGGRLQLREAALLRGQPGSQEPHGEEPATGTKFDSTDRRG